MKAEIWFGSNKAFCIDEAEELDWSINGSFVKITDKEGRTFETSEHNVIIIAEPTENRRNRI